jgi:hypothetical protein
VNYDRAANFAAICPLLFIFDQSITRAARTSSCLHHLKPSQVCQKERFHEQLSWNQDCALGQFRERRLEEESDEVAREAGCHSSPNRLPRWVAAMRHRPIKVCSLLRTSRFP